MNNEFQGLRRCVLTVTGSLLAVTTVFAGCGSTDGKKATQNTRPYGAAGDGGDTGVVVGTSRGGNNDDSPAGSSGEPAVGGSPSGGTGGGSDGGRGTDSAAGAAGQSSDADTCPVGMKNCDLSDPDCETPVNSVTTCGACDVHCDSVQGSSVCQDYVCVVPPGGCNAGFGDCDNDGRNGCETALDTATNCHSCGRVCDGACGPVGCAPELVRDVGPLYDWWFTPERVFYVTQYGLVWSPRGATTLPTTGTDVPSTGSVYALNGDKDYVYLFNQPFGGPSTIKRYAASATGALEDLAENLGGASYSANVRLRSNATAFFFNLGGTIQTLAKSSSGPPTIIVNNRTDIQSLVVGKTHIAWLETAPNSPTFELNIAPIAGGSGAAIKLVDQLPWGNDRATQALAIDDDYLYWDVAGNDGKVGRFKFGDTSATKQYLATSLTRPRGIAVDDKYAYYCSTDKIYRLAKGGGVFAEPVATDASCDVIIEVDAQFLWYLSSGKLGRVRK